METSLEVSRNMLRGIIRYIREHDNWTLDLTPGGIADQHLPDNWNGNGIIARIPSVKEAARLAAHPAPKVILDPQAAFTDASKLLLSFAMLLGRLEIYPMLIFLSLPTWKLRH